MTDDDIGLDDGTLDFAWGAACLYGDERDRLRRRIAESGGDHRCKIVVVCLTELILLDDDILRWAEEYGRRFEAEHADDQADDQQG